MKVVANFALLTHLMLVGLMDYISHVIHAAIGIWILYYDAANVVIGEICHISVYHHRLNS